MCNVKFETWLLGSKKPYIWMHCRVYKMSAGYGTAQGELSQVFVLETPADLRWN